MADEDEWKASHSMPFAVWERGAWVDPGGSEEENKLASLYGFYIPLCLYKQKICFDPTIETSSAGALVKASINELSFHISKSSSLYVSFYI